MSRFLRPSLLAAAAALVLTACGNGGQPSARAERMKPATSVTTMEVILRQSPGAPVGIGPGGTLKIDDVVLPQSPEKTAELQHYFGQLQMRRQQVLDQLQASGGKPVTIAPDAQLLTLQQQLLTDFPELRAYSASMETIRLESR